MNNNFRKVSDRWIKTFKVKSPEFQYINIHLTVRDKNNQPNEESVKFFNEFLFKLDEYLTEIIKRANQLHSKNCKTQDKGVFSNEIDVFVPGSVNSTYYELLLIADFLFKEDKNSSYAFCFENGSIVETILLG